MGLCVLPHSPLAVTFDREEVVSAFASQLDHVSPACRDVIFETIDSQVTIEVLMRKRWLRGVDFFPAGSRMEPHAGNTQSRELMRSSLIWKLAAFLLADWLRDPNKDSKSLNAQPVNEEETGETRRRKVGKRAGNYVARRPTSHHSGVGGPLWLRRGMVVIPPLGMSITPSFAHDESDGETVSEAIASWDQAMAVPIAHHSTCSTLEPDYDEFTPYESLDSVSLPKYDTFDEGDEAQSGVDDYGLPFLDRRSSLTAIHENENDSMSDFILQREILRSLQQAGASSANWSNGAVSSTKDEQVRPSKPNSSFEILSTAATRTSLGDIGSDAVHFSAFGPNDVGFRTTFRLDIWAYLREQRNVMLEVALEMNDNECGKRVQPFYVQRGALVTISIEPSEHFAVLGEDCKSFRWRGAVTGVSFDISRKLSAMDAVDNDSACIARIVAGSKVSLLYIRMRTRSTAMTKSYMNLLETEVESVLPDMKEIALEDLEVVRQIGSGSFGDAMLARWKANGQDNKYVVVKSLRSDVLGSSESAAEFRHEATVMHMLGKHPHVVELLGICPNSSPAHTRDSSSMYLVTEYMPNGSLHDVLGPSSKHVSESFSVFARTIMARDAAHGLVNIHQGHYLHRDIAARNCLVDDNFRVKVCDFGLSRRINSSGFYFDDDRHGFGPLKWMAPESILPPHLFSTQSDSYMFGVLMFEIFSGSVPFPSLSTREAIALILEGQHVPIPAHLPVTHQSLMRQCFESHPMARPSLDQIYVTLDQWVLQDTKAETQVPRWDNWRRNVL
ncbi:TPA: hypothetical protein N0F65_006431 [Lagenidium giganteum]|uniref:Protein kinase domain-containing protein n=1 Tax=Lagenidium giganteum TaxID=4803 RepID=A0AAV2Z445_9STRA|nr:TPA: hypothetical protein N0F65_006431 [Lagenidium giganteum]